jgi:hypothetical protein
MLGTLNYCGFVRFYIAKCSFCVPTVYLVYIV